MITNNSFIYAGYKKRRTRYIYATLALFILTIVLSILMLSFGTTSYSLSDILRVLKGEEVKGATFAITKIRLPRMIAAFLAGMAFGVSGNTFQTMLRNPLASPDIIGISSGCSVSAVYCILILGLSGTIVSVISLISGLIVATIIYMLAKGNSFSGGRLILIGIGVQALISSIISYILLKSSQYEISTALRWLNGSLNGITLSGLPILFIVVIIFTLINIALIKHLQVLELGDQFATTLGINVSNLRLFLILSSVFLLAFATSITGPIAFVAFLSGPIASKLVGGGQPKVLASGFVGASLVLSSDLIGQLLFSSRFPVGVITGALGAPYMLFLLVSINRKGSV